MKFQIPPDIFNDIIYCQKSLRHHIKIHQMLATTLMLQNVSDDHRLRDIEDVIMDIGADQKITLNRLRLAMEKYFISLENYNVPINRPELNAEIARELSANNMLYQNLAEPIGVKKRLTEMELILKYSLNQPIEIPQEVPAVLVATDQPKKPINLEMICDSDAEKFEVLVNPEDVATHRKQQQTVVSKQQVSLLKPRAERVTQPQKDSNAPINVIVMNKSPKDATVNTAYIPKYTATILSSTAPPPPKPTPIPTTAMNNSRMNLLQALNKAKHQSLNPPPPVQQQPTPAPPPSPSSSTSSISAAQLNKRNKRSHTTSSNSSSNSDDTKPIHMTRKHAIVPTAAQAVIQQKLSAAKIQSLKSQVAVQPVPASASMSETATANVMPTQKSPSSEEEINDLPEEEEEPCVLGKEAFLRVVGLCTHTYFRFLSARRSERKRRNVTSTEKGDFHYGKIDIAFEQLKHAQSQMAKSNKRTLLNSPPISKPNRRRKKITADAAGGPAIKKSKVDSSSTSSSSASSVTDDPNKLCISCAISNKEKMVECESCNFYYHMSCHTNSVINISNSNVTNNMKMIQQQATYAKGKEKFCPDCLRRQHKAKDTSYSQQRDQREYRKLYIRNEDLRNSYNSLHEVIKMAEQRTEKVRNHIESEQEENVRLEESLSNLFSSLDAITGEQHEIPAHIQMRISGNSQNR